jgi:hypothetical protein
MLPPLTLSPSVRPDVVFTTDQVKKEDRTGRSNQQSDRIPAETNAPHSITTFAAAAAAVIIIYFSHFPRSI